MSILEVNLEAIKSNIKIIKTKLKNNQKFCLVAKANAYGLGDKKVCKYLENEVDYFAVSSVEEFFSLNKKISKPILILDPIYQNIKKCARLNAEFCVANNNSFDAIYECAAKNKEYIFKIHLAINTGMNRFGFNNKKEVLNVLNRVKKTQNIFICGVFSHYFEASNQKYANFQYNKFVGMKNFINQNYNKNRVIYHIANSEGVLINENLNMVRIGIGAYLDSRFETMKLKSKIIDFKILKKGESAGYNRQFIAQKQTKLAIVAIGYADGLFRNIVRKGYVLIKDTYCKIVAICMDSVMVDITGVDCKIHDEVVIFGKDKYKQIFICDLASWCDTISYEILTHITKRVRRKYLEG